MKRLILLLLVCALSSCQKTELRLVEVTKTFDGDSFLVQDFPCLKCESFQVRLLGIDAPEKKQEAWGLKSKSKLLDLLGEDRLVYLEYDTDKLDRYKRHLAYAFKDKEKELLINEEMIRSGYAELFSFNKDLKYLDRLKAAEIAAREQEKGIWHSKTGLKLSPYKYRKQKKKSS
jgi:micrococcal nuclease